MTLQDALIDALQTKGYKGIVADMKTVLPERIVKAIVDDLAGPPIPPSGVGKPKLTTR